MSRRLRRKLDKLDPPPLEPLIIRLQYLCKDDPIPPPEKRLDANGRGIILIHEVATWER